MSEDVQATPAAEVPTPVTTANFLNRAFLASMESERRIYPQHTNRASAAGDQCIRRMQWRRTKWSEAILPPVSLVRRFELGKALEPYVIRKLEQGGIAVTQSQRPLEWKNFQLTGHIDGVVRCPDGVEAVVDVKTCSPFVLTKIRSIKKSVGEEKAVEALLEAESAYMRAYPIQVLLYALLMSVPRALLFFFDKSSGETETVIVDMSNAAAMNAAETALKKFTRVNEAIEAKVDLDPEPGEYCTECQFRNTCLPGLSFSKGMLTIMEDADAVAAMLTRMEELRDAAKEYDDLNDHFKEIVNEPGIYLVGDFQVEAKEFQRTAYDIPEEIKQPFAKKVPTLRRTVVRLKASSHPNAIPAPSPVAKKKGKK